MPKLFGLFSLLDLLEAAGFDEAPAFVSDALDAVTKLLTEAQRLQGGDRRRAGAPDRGGRRRGARRAREAVAQRAKDELDALVGPPRRPTSTRSVAAVQGLPGNPDAVSAAAVALAGDLQPLLDAIGVPGVPAAVRSALEKPVQVLKTLTDIAKDAAGLAQMLQGAAGGQVTARMSWRPVIKPWGLPGAPEHLQAEARTPCTSTSRCARRRALRRRSTSSRRSSTSTSTSSATATPG